MNESDMDVLAVEMLRDFDARTPGTAFGRGLRLSLDEAWQLQAEVSQLRQERGEQVIGYKIGCVVESCQQKNGLVHPVFGRLWSAEQYLSGVSLRKSDFANVAIEGEFAVTLCEDIPAGASTERITAAISEVLPVIELHHLVMRGSAPRGAELIANNTIHAGVVRGPATDVGAESIATALEVRFDDSVVDSWKHLVWPEEILKGLAWLSSQLPRFGLELKSGQTILTGAFGPALPLGDATDVRVVSSAFGEVTATIT